MEEDITNTGVTEQQKRALLEIIAIWNRYFHFTHGRLISVNYAAPDKDNYNIGVAVDPDFLQCNPPEDQAIVYEDVAEAYTELAKLCAGSNKIEDIPISVPAVDQDYPSQHPQLRLLGTLQAAFRQYGSGVMVDIAKAANMHVNELRKFVLQGTVISDEAAAAINGAVINVIRELNNIHIKAQPQ